ncbi:YfdX protein [Thioclava sp. ES.031]|uniref:YfdX family protein n=1 Tax=Thioclava sp. ES.031 TaxID=1798203 RepID=UPI000C01805C|nr:YfdX family protein [Thioclava sp. ES.031]PFG62825.1 YfdX protein [Thioclava sp. ES.031]
MERSKKFLALALSSALIAGPASFEMANAATTSSNSNSSGTAMQSAQSQGNDAVSQTTASSTDKDLLTTVNDAYTAMREVRAARLAIFDGNTDMATKMTKDATAKMQAAEKAESKWGVPSKAGKKGVTYLPFDSSIALGESFTVTPDNQKAVGKANQQMAQGNAKAAAKTLKDNDIDVSISAAMVPAKASLAHLQDASKLIKSGNYYEANLALKGVEDSVVIDQWGLDNLPQQAGNATKSSANASGSTQMQQKSQQSGTSGNAASNG